MQKTQLYINEWGLVFGLCVLSLALFLQWRYRKNENSPALFYSDIQAITELEKTWRMRFVFLPPLLKKVTFGLFIIALCNPIIQLPSKEKKSAPENNQADAQQENKRIEEGRVPTEGLAIYFILDQSGSMREEFEHSIKQINSKRMTRIDALKFFTTQFIFGNSELGLNGRDDDLIGLVAFARVPKIITPLTLDHHSLKEQLDHFHAVNTPMEEGTAIGYAIYKTAHTIAATEHFAKELVGNDKPAYDIKSTIMVLVTDGIQNPSSEDLEHPIRRIGIEEAAQFAKEKNIRLYIINIQPAIGFSDFIADRSTQKRAAELTGGQFFLANDVHALHRIYKVIDGLERSKHYGTGKHHLAVEEKIVASKDNTHQPQELLLYSYLIIAGMLCLLMAILLETTLLKKVP